MRRHDRKRQGWIVLLLGISIGMLSGCRGVGPIAISQGRLAYDAAITQTDEQQLLMAIVNQRYGEAVSLLTVSSVTANLSFTTNVGVSGGFNSADFLDNPGLSANLGVGYADNPTISYVPIRGEQYIRHLLTPIPLDLLVLFLNTYLHVDVLFELMVNRVNDLNNHSFLPLPARTADTRFLRLMELFRTLNQARLLSWLEASDQKNQFVMLIRTPSPSHVVPLREFLNLIGYSAPITADRDLIIPLFFAQDDRPRNGMAISTRSAFEIMELLAASMEVPEAHARSGLAATYPPLGTAAQKLHIHQAEDEPQQAAVAVPYRRSWFYIDETDQFTKLAFRLIQALWGISLSKEVSHLPSAPVLTVPVSRSR